MPVADPESQAMSKRSRRPTLPLGTYALALTALVVVTATLVMGQRFGDRPITIAGALIVSLAVFYLGCLTERLRQRNPSSTRPARSEKGIDGKPVPRDVDLSDLIKRGPVKVDSWLIAPHVENRVVLVTGAGGSIGSELCRQMVSFKPKRLLLLGHGENSLFAIDQELRVRFQFTNTNIILADVADGPRIRQVFANFRPHLVFHAAAHKHVPIIEENICEAVRNNIFGTHVLALAAAATGVAKFVMVSTDKAVKPTSIMGATKRISEQICRSFERRTGTEFVSVRFGNVLGSRGSVIGIFRKQIEDGGPVTVTHPDMVRYFMTIPEAVALVLEAMAIGRDSQVFVMDMGQPVRVVELAESFVTLSGLRPYVDIDIVFTGIRPGEKLREEVLTTEERNIPTINERLFVAQQLPVEYEKLALVLKEMDLEVRRSDVNKIVSCIRSLVPSFQPGAHLKNSESTSVESLDAPASSESSSPTIYSNGHAAAAPAVEITPVGGHSSSAAAVTLQSSIIDASH
ncbi:MAG: polysaccharide biosynthesis protein [Candidatus Eremiobacteraeota bacterium]|nr:polysaccharide biosynthesis protein [Candidatus Eremiobacteraeota bacterium]